MTVDYRREVAYVWKQYNAFYATIGEEVIWFPFDTVESRYDDIYDEGSKTYKTGIRMPALWVDQVEDPEQYSAEGRRPTKRLRFAVSARSLQERGVATLDAHGRRMYDVPPVAPNPAQYGRPDSPWLDDRLNDVVFYDGRFFAVSDFQIRGRAKEMDLIIGVAALEVDMRDEGIWDQFPWNTPWGDPATRYDEFETLNLIAKRGTPLVAEVSLHADLSGSSWVAAVAEPGKADTVQFSVDTSEQAAGTLVLTLPDNLIDNLFTGTAYVWRLVQQVAGEPDNVLMRGSLTVED